MEFMLWLSARIQSLNQIACPGACGDVLADGHTREARAKMNDNHASPLNLKPVPVANAHQS